MDALMSWAQEAQERRFHSMATVRLQWEPLLFRGVDVVAAFSGYSFGLLQKSNSPARRDSQSIMIGTVVLFNSW